MLRLICIAVLFALPAFTADNFQECRTGPFEVWTNGSDREARQLLVRLEQARYVLGSMLGKPDLVSRWTIRVLLVKDKTSAPWILGRDAWVSILPAGAPPKPEWMKGVVQMLLESNARRMLPEWENGIIAYLSTLDAVGPKITLGAPPPGADKNKDWARVQFLATNVEYTSRLRVLMNNLQNGADEDVAYRNSIGITRAELDKQIDAFFAAANFNTSVISGRPLSERDFPMRPVEPNPWLASIADATKNSKLLPASAVESAEWKGLDAAAQGRKEEALDWLKQAIAGKTKSARVYLEYGNLLTDSTPKQDAYVEAAKKNAKWALPYIKLADMESTPEREAFYLKTATTIDPRDSALWQRLAKAQLEAKQFGDASKSWFSAEMAAPTRQEREAIRGARRDFEQNRADREDAEKQRIADERQRELDRLKNEALNSIKEAEVRANKGRAPLDPNTKVVEWWDDNKGAQRLSGVFQKVDCLGKAARVWIAPPAAKPVAFYIKDPGQIVLTGGGEVSFGCGPQKPQRNVTVEYKPRVDAKLGTQGDVTVIEFR